MLSRATLVRVHKLSQSAVQLVSAACLKILAESASTPRAFVACQPSSSRVCLCLSEVNYFLQHSKSDTSLYLQFSPKVSDAVRAQSRAPVPPHRLIAKLCAVLGCIRGTQPHSVLMADRPSNTHCPLVITFFTPRSLTLSAEVPYRNGAKVSQSACTFTALEYGKSRHVLSTLCYCSYLL